MVAHTDKVDQSDGNVILQRLWTSPNSRIEQRAVSNTYKDIECDGVEIDNVRRG